MKGIILAGGSGSRLYPATKAMSKQLIPIYDKPMIYYPLSVLMLAGIRDVMIISTPRDLPSYQRLFNDGANWGLNLTYAEQSVPNGLAQAFIIGKDFIGSDSVCLILGDNIFYGYRLFETLHIKKIPKIGATIFAYWVKDPERYGVVELDKAQKAVSIEEKPKSPKSNHAVTGLYFYDNNVLDIAANLKPSDRGEYEITDVNHIYLEKGLLNVSVLTRGVAWFDTGTHDSLLKASVFVESIENRQGLKIACLEEIAYKMGYIGVEDVIKIADSMNNSEYGQYLLRILENRP
jgi:glucose-1-phosphate thymidylyltransferase